MNNEAREKANVELRGFYDYLWSWALQFVLQLTTWVATRPDGSVNRIEHFKNQNELQRQIFDDDFWISKLYVGIIN